MKFLACSKLSSHRYKTPEGYLVCVDSVLSRTGDQEYTRDDLFKDGSNKRISVGRSAEEVFSDKALASFENKPLTIEHPNEDVNPENYNKYSVGFVRDVKRGKDNNEDVMLATIVVTDAEAIDLIESGKLKELSCGYDCDIEDEEHPQQRNIRGNHVALCEHGRAGIARIVDSIKEDKKNMIKDVKAIHENIREQIIYVMQSDVDKNLYFYIGNKYAMKEGDYTYQQYDMEGMTPEALRDDLKKNGWHQVSKGPAPFIDSTAYNNAEDSCDKTKANDAKKLPSNIKKDLNRIFRAKSTYLKNKDYDVSEFVDEIERIFRIDSTPIKIIREKINGWNKTGDGMLRKDYTFSIDGYDDRFLVSLYANPDTWETTELNCYFLDSCAKNNDETKKKYLVHYIDQKTDRSVKIVIEADSVEDARKKITQNYEPYRIINIRAVDSIKDSLNATRVIRVIKSIKRVK